jgi:hypothetical protein
MPKRPLWTPLRRKIFAGFLTANYFFFILLFPFSTAQAMPLFRGTFLPHGNDFTYDNQGRAVRYRQQTTQIEHYSYVKQIQKGLKRKNRNKETTGSVTTDS